MASSLPKLERTPSVLSVSTEQERLRAPLDASLRTEQAKMLKLVCRGPEFMRLFVRPCELEH